MSEERAIGRWRALAGPAAVPEPRSRGLSWWGMVLVIATEATLFAVLIASYFYLRWKHADTGWPPEGIPNPDLLRPSLITGAALLAAPFMVMAHAAAGRTGRAALVCGLLGVVTCALAFIGLQTWDWIERVPDELPQDGAYSSLNYTLTGAHLAHLGLGLLFVGWVFVRAVRGAYGPGRDMGVRVVALYWYFVVALAVAVYLTVYITPYL